MRTLVIQGDKKHSGQVIKVANKNATTKSLAKQGIISQEDERTDVLVRAAVKAAIKKAEVCEKPIAVYDPEEGKAYLRYPNGEYRR